MQLGGLGSAVSSISSGFCADKAHKTDMLGSKQSGESVESTDMLFYNIDNMSLVKSVLKKNMKAAVGRIYRKGKF